MLLTRTPLRISFLGGGSDFPEFFKNHIGAVLGTTVNLYVYTAILKHSQLADGRFKLTYRENESVNEIKDIQHPLVRETLKFTDWNSGGIHIATLADVPANTGLGSSSAFAVGMLKGIYESRKEYASKKKIAEHAIRIEREILNEDGGWQDQIHSSFGGFNSIVFEGKEFHCENQVRPLNFDTELNRRIVLIAAGQRRASQIHAKRTVSALNSRVGLDMVKEMAILARETSTAISKASSSRNAISELCDAIRESWKIKKKLASLPEPEVLKIINLGLTNGATAAKLCGAGGSGYVLFILEEGVKLEEFETTFDSRRIQQISMVPNGSQVLEESWSE